MWDRLGLDNHRQLDRELRQMRNAFRKLPSALGRKYVRKAVTEATKELRQEVRRVTPKGRTGNLRKAIRTAFKYRHHGDGFFSFRIGFDKKKGPHAHLLESGTKQRRTKKGANRGRGPALHFFGDLIRSRASTVAQRIAQRLKANLEKAMKDSLP